MIYFYYLTTEIWSQVCIFSVWQEVFDDGDLISSKTIVDIWKGGVDNWQEEAFNVSELSIFWLFLRCLLRSTISQVTRAGYQAVISSPFYLNYISYGIDWLKYYKVDITNFSGSIEQKRLIKGGEVSWLKGHISVERPTAIKIRGQRYNFVGLFVGRIHQRIQLNPHRLAKGKYSGWKALVEPRRNTGSYWPKFIHCLNIHLKHTQWKSEVDDNGTFAYPYPIWPLGFEGSCHKAGRARLSNAAQGFSNPTSQRTRILWVRKKLRTD